MDFGAPLPARKGTLLPVRDAKRQGVKPQLAGRMVERAHFWLNHYRRILVRWEKLAITYQAMLHFVCAVTI